MTGEVTLRGKALAIGGLREKSLAALRSGIKKIIIPSENKKHVSELPKEVRIPFPHPVEKPLQQTNLSVGASRSTAKQSVCRYQPDDGTHGLHLWRTYRTDDDDSRRTDRSDRLEYLARIQHGSKHVRGAKLCRPEKRTCPGCLPYDTENDCPVRNLLYVAFRVLRQRSILTDHTRKGRL